MLSEKNDQKIKKFENRLDKNLSVIEKWRIRDLKNILLFMFIIGFLFLISLDF